MMYGTVGMFGSLGLLLWLVVSIDLVLAGIWLWQQISKDTDTGEKVAGTDESKVV